mmetsp:Transcript_14918/g.33142  ORF Transcript_14918/g.33142 Transcript_14918/m.33142 type:complete len:462 (-) Transcript_14918:73-1458(-)
MGPEEAASELVLCARYGEEEELRDIVERYVRRGTVDVNVRDGAGGNTALHMACANGHASCVRLLLEADARHLPNASGNRPLHWACRGKHEECARLLLRHYRARGTDEEDDGTSIDVLAKNSFGRGALTEAFDGGDTGCVQCTLEHETAAEERLVGGADGNKQGTKKGTEEGTKAAVGGDAEGGGDVGVVGVVHEFSLVKIQSDDGSEPPKDGEHNKEAAQPKNEETKDREVQTLLARELPIAHPDDPFGSESCEDTTGLSIWAASIICARWLASLSPRFRDKSVLELGAGVGLPGLAVAHYAAPSSVVLTDLHAPTIQNLEHNMALNADRGRRPREEYDVRVRACAVDWDDPATYPRSSVDFLVGSDLIYQKEIVPLLKKAVLGMLADQGSFLYVCPEGGRDGLEEFIASMARDGFRLVSKEVAPEEFKENPLSAGDDEECFLHFHELFSTTYVLYEFQKT